MTADVGQLNRSWLQALADAELSPDAVFLYTHDDPPRDGRPTAIHVPPGVVVMGRDASPLAPEQAQHALDNFGRHQILLYKSAELDVLAAKLRHELEHVKQWEFRARGKDLFQLYQGIGCALDRVIGSDPSLRLGSGVLYNIIPMEVEANAAASRFIRPCIDPARLPELEAGENGVLFRSYPQAEPIDGLALRMVCAAAMLGQQVEDAFGDGNHPDGRLGLQGLAADQKRYPSARSVIRASVGFRPLDVA